MRKTATLLTIAFFSLVLAGFIVIQFLWITTLQKDKFQALKTDAISAINTATTQAPFTGSSSALTVAAVTNTLQRSFSAQGWPAVPFEFRVAMGPVHLTSKGFQQLPTGASNRVTLQYVFQRESAQEELLTVIIPHAQTMIWNQMIGMIAISLLLTLMMLTVFCCAIISGGQLFYARKDTLFVNMLQRLETPLTTVSIAAEALRNTRVMHDLTRFRFYQQVITDENKRMDAEVNQLLRDLK